MIARNLGECLDQSVLRDSARPLFGVLFVLGSLVTSDTTFKALQGLMQWHRDHSHH